MKFNKWVIFIKESRDWHMSKYCSIDYCLIKRYDNNDDDDDGVIDITVMNSLRCLCDDFVRMLLVFQVSVWYHMREVTSDCVCYMRKVVKKKDYLMNLCNI